ncbi:hypothetical protein KFE25_009873 [Diacronema lutheri]|uniref:DUF7886 domain-containing protein n=2 Tax=Diacronema lutheri TaxID=2081491 RepID=A0A8J5XJD2_DIALT|nr:hypothetical protein KFE25_009873 [Diacronema lutheri]
MGEDALLKARMSSKDRRVDLFCKECARFGALEHFRYLRMQLRGREELLVTISHADARRPGAAGSPRMRGDVAPLDLTDADAAPSWSPTVAPAPGLRGRPPPLDDSEWGRPLEEGEDGADRAPASPCERERLALGEHEVVFLVGSYMHYRCPHVWVRAGHTRLARAGEAEESSASARRDVPLRLQSLSRWSTAPEDGQRLEVHLWAVLAELVQRFAHPLVRNPFEVELDAVAALPTRERAEASASLALFLREVYLGSDELADCVEADYLALLQIHYMALPGLVATPAAPSAPPGLQLDALAAAFAACAPSCGASWPGYGCAAPLLLGGSRGAFLPPHSPVRARSSSAVTSPPSGYMQQSCCAMPTSPLTRGARSSAPFSPVAAAEQ